MKLLMSDYDVQLVNDNMQVRRQPAVSRGRREV